MATPVGLFGLVRKTTRVRGVMAARTHEGAAGDRCIEPEDLEGRLRDEGFGDGCSDGELADPWSEIGDRERHDAFVEPVGQRDALDWRAEIAGDRLRCLGVRRIEANLVRPQIGERFDDFGRTAARVLVLMQTEAVVELRRFSIMTHG